MARTRQEIRSLGDKWNPTTLWYAKAVRALLDRPITKKAGWRYLAAMHDFNQARWLQLGYLSSTERLPIASEQARYWRQCQHQTWYFLPWHRAYLLTFEDVVRDAIRTLGGPADTWALPYWNYSASEAQARNIPPAFIDRKMPDGSANPLVVEARFGTSVAKEDVELRDRISDHDFVGVDGGPEDGVGGPRTVFSPHGAEEGLIEAKPHDLVHGDVGGRGGLMSSPTTAALDPIFWLHHANIDRLWEVWRKRDASNRDPTDPAWLNGPTRPRRFALFGADENDRAANPKDVVSLAALGYDYDDTSDPLKGTTRRAVRLEALAPRALAMAATERRTPAMAKRPPSELLGSNDTPVALGPTAVTTRVKLAKRPLERLSRSFSASAMAPNTPGEPDRVFLRLENIRGKEGSGIFDVFVRRADEPADAPGIPVGSISLFGVEQASEPDGERAGNGLTKTVEVTKAVDAMQLHQAGAEALDVRLVPRSDVREDDDITVGQVTVHRRSGQ